MSNRTERPIFNRLMRIAGAPGLGFIPIALLLFLLADMSLSKIVERRLAEGPFRFGKSSVALVDEIISCVAKAPSPKAVFLGDSVVRGARSGVSETLPVFYERQLGRSAKAPWKVFNLGLTAGNNSDKMLLLQRLLDAGCRPDLILVADNMKFYSRQYPVQTARYKDLAAPPVGARHPRLVHKTLGIKQKPRKTLWALPDEIAENITSRLFIVRNRDFLSSGLGAGDHPFRRGLTIWNHIKRRFAAASEAQDEPEGYRRAYDLPESNLKIQSGVNLRALAEIQKTCAADDLNCFFYLTPTNTSKGNREKILTSDTVEHYKKAVGSVLSADPERNADLTDFLDETDFHDMDHPTKSGMKKLAVELAARTKQFAGAAP